MIVADEKPTNSRALFEFSISFLPYIFLLILAWVLSGESYWWVLLLAIPTHFFHARLFVIMHDCGHQSFFEAKFLNDLIGHICAFFYFVPFYMWRELHNKHHRNHGYLGRRNESLDVWTLTTAEFASSDSLTKWRYRVYRHPLVLFFVAPLILFIVLFRLPFEKFSAKAYLNILVLDLIYFSFGRLFPQFSMAVLLVLLPSLTLSFIMASFLFYIQHQFENSYWTDVPGGKNLEISLYGSSFLKIPSAFEWCYGYINYHHLHHFDVRIPLYRLKSAHRSRSLDSKIQSYLSLGEALRASKYKLWDEKKQKFVTF